MNNFAIAISLGLQYGVPLEEYRRGVHLHALRAGRLVQGNDAHQDGDFDHRLHLPRTRDLLSGPHDLAHVDPSEIGNTVLGGGVGQDKQTTRS